ncbi:hypothetical protein LC612_17700 [Nostoc sp. CHAB 5834]|nr:hypothetical protein [Nostoc sp. CHAB 5834]
MSDLVFLPAHQLAQMICDRQVSAEMELLAITQELDKAVGDFRHPLDISRN